MTEQEFIDKRYEMFVQVDENMTTIKRLSNTLKDAENVEATKTILYKIQDSITAINRFYADITTLEEEKAHEEAMAMQGRGSYSPYDDEDENGDGGGYNAYATGMSFFS